MTTRQQTRAALEHVLANVLLEPTDNSPLRLALHKHNITGIDHFLYIQAEDLATLDFDQLQDDGSFLATPCTSVHDQ